MTDTADIHAGLTVAARAIRELAESDERALAVLNAASESEVRWAAAMLLSGTRELLRRMVDDDPGELRTALLTCADQVEHEHVVVTQAEAIVARADLRGGDL
ncbi:hypothetical protein ACOACO_18430 [Nocardioides sp. CPCC 205120]|uniref:hypothetical protein n=1 Tax=Nocardioides sp. CPCC 205120 TaxID=3406462 RepID=UPI003B508A1C